MPKEWPHGAILPDGNLAKHAPAQAFPRKFDRRALLERSMSDESAVCGPDGKLYLHGGNFSMARHTPKISGIDVESATENCMTDTQIHEIQLDGQSSLPFL